VEVIVVDGGSSDATLGLARPLSDKAVSAARGRGAQMNAGAALAAGEVLLFLHADTLLPPNADTLIAEGLAGGEHAWGRFDVAITPAGALLRTVAHSMNLRSRLTGIATGDQAIFVRRDVFFWCGGYPHQPLMEDIALSRALKRKSPPLCLRACVVTSARRWQKHGVLRTIVLMWLLRLAYFCGADPARLAKTYEPENS
jgi:rSAM/selenodomain-associated transferase 2